MRVVVWVRFSIRMGGWLKKVDIRESEREEWFRFRADVFNRGLLECLRRQTLKPETVLILIDPADRELLTTCINTADGLVEPLCVTPRNMHETLAIRLASPNEDLLACRIDSDDLVADDYLERFAEDVTARAPVSPVFFTAANGYVSNLDSIQPYRFETSPFFGAYFPAGTPMKSFGRRHMELDRDGVVLVNETARWMQLIHPSNVSNRMLWADCQSVNDATWPVGFYRPPVDLFALRDWRKPSLRLSRLRFLKRGLVNSFISSFRKA